VIDDIIKACGCDTICCHVFLIDQNDRAYRKLLSVFLDSAFVIVRLIAFNFDRDAAFGSSHFVMRGA